MEKKNRVYDSHCLVLAFPGQGHINPAIQFSKRLQYKGIKVTFVSTHHIINTILGNSSSSSFSISVETISDGFDEGGIDQAESAKAYMDRFRDVGSKSLANLIENLNVRSDLPVNYIVYDSYLGWSLDVAKKFGLAAACFFTQPCVVVNAYYHVFTGRLELPIPSNSQISLPGLHPLEPQDLPSFLYDLESYPAFLEFQMQQFSNIDGADCVLCNTVYELEPEVIHWMAKMWPLRAIGPTIPSKYLDKRLPNDINYDLNMFKPNNDVCINWLNNKSKNSVAYVSFGSLATLNAEQMTELSWGIRRSRCYFLWVVRAMEQEKLPKGFLEETKDRGLVVSWCSQLEVLSHDAIGCFVTHCGWNSSLEALSLGVPIVTMPQWSDQSTNAKYICDVWRVGLKPLVDEKGIVRQESVQESIQEIMEGDKAKEIRENATKWKVLIKQAMEEGGSSDQAINDFVAGLANGKKYGVPLPGLEPGSLG